MTKEDAFIQKYIHWMPIEGPRCDWLKIWCEYQDCPWNGSGSEKVVESSAQEHAAEHLEAGATLEAPTRYKAEVRIWSENEWQPTLLISVTGSASVLADTISAGIEVFREDANS